MILLSKEQEILMEISRKLDALIILAKLSNLSIIANYRKKVLGDKVYSKILEYSDGSMSYSQLSEKISKELNVAEITVKKKISDLREMGFLLTERRGNQVYYIESDLFK
jgi:DNA-binding transcriptional ArsR family regulator